jgi:hypothetical protein
MRFPVLLIAVLLAFALTACGGDENSNSTATPATATQGESGGPTTSAGPESDPKQGADSGSEGGSDSANGSGSAASGSTDATAPLQVSGGGSAQFRTKGGDNSVEEFGEEGDGSELQEAAEVVHSFYVARVAGEWARACSYMAASQVEQLEQLAAQSPQLKGKGCPPILDALTRPLSDSLKVEITTVDAGSLRRDGEQGFLIYRGARDTVYSMPLEEEDGEWKVSALAASAQP